MIRPFTLVTMLLAAGSGAYLFAVKYHAQMLDDQIADISQASRLDAQRVRVLQAQWALETDPTRLQQLAAQFTDLKPMQPSQLVTLASLATELPPPGAVPPAANPELPVDAQPELDAAARLAADLPLPPPPASMLLAAVSDAPAPAEAAPQRLADNAVPAAAMAAVAVPPPPAPPRHHAIHVAPHSASVPPAPPARTELADAAMPRPPAPRPRPVPEAHHSSASVLASAGPEYRPVPLGARVVSVKASEPAPRYVPQPATDISGSVLGMAAALPPPQPYREPGH